MPTRSHSIEPLEARQLLSDSPTATVVGNVFRDANRNGVKDATEVGLANIKAFLDYNNNGTRDGDGEPIATTNGDGRYTFSSVTPTANLAIRLLLSGTNFEQTLPADNGPRRVNAVAGQTAEAERFGVAEKVTTPPPVETPTTLGGIVFTDRNRDGVKNSGEVGRAGVKVYLDTNNNGMREDGEPQTTTDSAGRYKFSNVAVGTTHVRLNLVNTNLVQTKPSNNGGYDVSVVAHKENRVEIFGVAERVATATVTGTIYTDANNNGQRDDGERGRAGVKVYLDLNNNGKREDGEPITTSAGSTGRYIFERVPTTSSLTIRLLLDGTRLAQTQPANNAGRSLTPVAGVRYVDQNFGVREIPTEKKGALRGLVFNDLDSDGTRDDGEKGIGGRIVYLDLNHNGTRDEGDRATTTNGEGRYVFEGVVAGEYDVRVYLGDYTQTLPAEGKPRHVTLAGATVGDLNFGLRLSRA